MLKLTGGTHRGRALKAPKGELTRPSQAKMREAMFNSLQGFIEGTDVLDLFAGSGMIGFEALSRGANRVTFVEKNRAAISSIKQNAKALGVEEQIQIVTGDIEKLWEKIEFHGPYHFAFADPPYAEDWSSFLLVQKAIGEMIWPEGYFCVEWRRQKGKKSGLESLPLESPGLSKVREKDYGEAVLTTYRRGLDQ